MKALLSSFIIILILILLSIPQQIQAADSCSASVTPNTAEINSSGNSFTFTITNSGDTDIKWITIKRPGTNITITDGSLAEWSGSTNPVQLTLTGGTLATGGNNNPVVNFDVGATEEATSWTVSASKNVGGSPSFDCSDAGLSLTTSAPAPDATPIPTPTPDAGGGATAAPAATSAPAAVATATPTPTPTPTPVPDTTAPQISITSEFTEPVAKAPIIEGEASDNVGVTRVEYSVNGGTSWIEVDTLTGTGGKSVTFSFIPTLTEDGNYEIKTRATDAKGNTGESESKTLIIDTFPPIFGGNMLILGSGVITPDQRGLIRVISGAEIKMVVSFKGGVIKGSVESNGQSFALEKIEGSNLWLVNLKFEQGGGRDLTLKAIDGAGNENEIILNSIFVEESGQIREKDNGELIDVAKVEVFFFDLTTDSWTPWDATAFGQENPQNTGESGSYSYFLPPGRYYIEATAPGFKTARSEILDFTDNTIVNFDFALSSKPKFTINLPIFGEVVFSLPSFTPPDTLSTSLISKKGALYNPAQVSIKKGIFLPNFSLSDSDGFLVSGTQFAGRELMISFLSPWSIQSIEQVRVIDETHIELSKKEEILTIFVQESPGALETFMRRGNYEFNALVDERGIVSQDQFSVTTLPQHFFVDRTGVVQEIVTGLISKQEIIERLEELK